MTTYLRSKLSKREIGAGCETYAYQAWGKPNQVTIFTTNRYKWYWLSFLGLTRSEQIRVYTIYDLTKWGRKVPEPYWKFNVVKLLSPNWQRLQNHGVWEEVRRFSYQIKRNNPEEFKVMRPIIDFCLLMGVEECITDFNYFNFLQHPRTRKIYPYDVYVPHNLDLSKLGY